MSIWSVGKASVSTLALAAALVAMPTTAAPSEPRAALQGEMEKPVRTEIERAIGAAKGAPGSRVDARRRAREAAQAAIAVLRSEGYYDYHVEPAIGEGDTPAAISLFLSILMS